MVNFIHYFGYLEFGYMEFPLIWDILAGTNAFLVTGIVCIVIVYYMCIISQLHQKQVSINEIRLF